MIRNKLHKCCYCCDTPDVEVVTDKYGNLAGDATITNQLIRCTHEPICCIVREEEKGKKNENNND